MWSRDGDRAYGYTDLAAGGVERRLEVGSPYHGSNLRNGPGRAEGWSLGTPVVLAWRKGSGKHTSIYIDNAEWKKAISEAGSRQMKALSQGDWRADRWEDLIDSAGAFSRDSGLFEDSSRNELVTLATAAVASAGAEGLEVMLCMLGESVAIVPLNPSEGRGWIEGVITELDRVGLEGLETKVGELS